MSEAEESSYYEIALTNRQVLGGFVVLLGCMLAAFFSGVWVGRGGAAAGAQPAPVEETATTENAGLESFRFFSEEEGEAQVEEVDLGAPPAVGEPGRTLAEDVGATPPPRRPQPVPVEPPTVAEGGSSSAAAVPRTTARRPDEGISGELFVQVFSTHDEDQARKVLRRLLDGQFKAFLSPAEVGNKTTYRVRIGPFEDRSEAERIARRVQQTHKLDTWITSS